jgi:hypothetical protein
LAKQNLLCLSVMLRTWIRGILVVTYIFLNFPASLAQNCTNSTNSNSSSCTPYWEQSNPCGLNILNGVEVAQYDEMTSKTTGPACVVVDTQVNATKTVYYPYVDEFSLLEISRSFNSTVTMFNATAQTVANNTVIFLQIANVVSPTRMYTYYDPRAKTTYVVPFLTAIVQVSSGTITGITWDSGCYSCSGAACVQGICAVPINECGDSDATTNCDVKVYLSWTGTDRNSRYLTSSAAVITNFEQYGITNAFEAAAATTTQAYPLFGVYNPSTGGL